MADEETPQPDEKNIAAAAMTAVGPTPGSPGGKGLSKLLEAAMSQAVTQALAEGISIEDSEKILERKHAARKAVLDEYYGRAASAEAPPEG